MIIKVTPAEIKGFVATSLNLNPSRFEIEIVNPADTSLRAALRQALHEFPRSYFDEKISCIKRFRELAPRQVDREGFSSCVIGLADAKWAVENPTVALANLERTGRILG